MRLRIIAAIAVTLLALLPVGSALAGSQGYEGQPGNQSSGGHGGNGPSGYEGQPGNQSH